MTANLKPRTLQVNGRFWGLTRARLNIQEGVVRPPTSANGTTLTCGDREVTSAFDASVTGVIPIRFKGDTLSRASAH